MQNIITETARKIGEKEAKLALWLEKKSKDLTMPVTASVDIRNAGFKISVIDTNVFPAGFNNLCNTFSKRTGQLFRDFLKKEAPKARNILIIPETFTRNIPYFLHLKRLESVLKEAGLQVAVGFLGDLPQTPWEVTLPSKETIHLERVEKGKREIRVASMEPDLILLNNDCSEGIPDFLKNIQQPIFPSPELGWHSRKKKRHFEIYCQLAGELGEILLLDCWFFCPITFLELGVDVDKTEDMERVAKKTQEVLKKTQTKYQKYGIAEKPYVFIKSNSGTFGLGQIHIEDPEEILTLNRKSRKKLQASKGGKETSEFLIQEGIPTIDSFEGAPIEPVLYYVGGELAGGFFRIHKDKDTKASLNTPGSRFEPLCFHKDKEGKEINLHCEDHNDFFVIAQWLGKLATLAVALETKEL